MAASTAIMHATSTAGNSGGVLGSSSKQVPTSTASSGSASSNGCASSSSDEEELGSLRVEEEEIGEEEQNNLSLPAKTTQIPTESSDTHSEKMEEDATGDAPVVEEDTKNEENENPTGVVVESASPSPKTAEVSEDSASTIVGDDEDENSQQSIEVDDKPVSKTPSPYAKESEEEVEVEDDSKEQSSLSTETVFASSSPPQSGLFGGGGSSKASNGPKKALATGKLERITAALAAKKQSSSSDRQLNIPESASSAPAFPISSSAAALMLTQFGAAGSTSALPHESSTTATTISEDDESGMIEDDDDDDDLDDEEEEEGLMMDENGLMIMDDEDDEEIKNGFRALGLMGNVAFMGEEKFKCPVCGLKLDSQHTFTLHIRSHNPNDHSNTCRLCGKTLSSASSLDRHMLIHSGERPFKCSICNMAFTTNGNMHRHMRTHGHGTIGYTPRGAKRRAKLFAQQAAKVAAAAAAGEPVDAATISKLKKSALEVTTGNGKSPISGTPMKKQRGSGGGGRKSTGINSDSFGGGGSSDEGVMGGEGGAASAATLAEAEQIAAAAAAYAASVAATNSSSNSGGGGDHHHQHGHSRKRREPKCTLPLHPIHVANHNTAAASSTSHHLSKPNPHHSLQHPSLPNLSNHRLPGSSSSTSNHPLNPHNPLSGWPSTADLGLLTKAAAAAVAASNGGGNPHHQNFTNLHQNAFNNHSSFNNNAPVILPQKGKPGRKRKIRPEEAAMMNSNGLNGLSQNSTSSPSFPANAFSNLTGPTTCPICAGRLNSKMELHLHMTSFHSAEKLFCLDCGMILDNYSVYTQHHCTVTAAAVMQALAANPQANPELLFRSTNTSRMNFSSARFGGSGNSGSNHLNPNLPGNGGSHHNNGHHSQQQQQQDHLSSMLSQLSKSPFFNSQQPSNSNQQRSSSSSALPIVDLSAKSSKSSSNGSLLQPPQTVSAHQAAHHFSNGPACNQCGRKFANTKLLKTHFDTFCHECAADCGSQAGLMSHQIQHSIEKFPNLSKALGNSGGGSGAVSGKSEGFNMAAALPGLLGMQAAAAAAAATSSAGGSNPLVASALTSTSSSNSRNGGSPSPFNKRHSYPKPPPASTSLDLTVSTNSAPGSSLASLTSTMADMKPDLADIQSIISMAKHAKLPLNATAGASNSSQFVKTSSSGMATNLPLSLSPNRASDAGVDAKKASARNGGGQEAGSHPDSPASADSAAAAVAAAHSHGHASQLATSSLTSGHHLKNGHESAKGVNGDGRGSNHQHTMENQVKQTATSVEDDYVEAEEEDDDGEACEEEEEEEVMMGEEEEDEEGEPGLEMDVGEEDKNTSTKSSGKRRRRQSASDSTLTPTKKSRQENHQQDQHSPSSTTSSNLGSSLDQSGQQRFRCEQCRLSFKSMNAFRRHNRGHTAGGGHSHACHLCPYKSLDKSTLIRHLRTHNGERPFQCAICKYAFTTKANCERHVRKRHRNLKSKMEIRAAMQYNRDMAATAAATRMVSEKIFIERDELPTSQDTVCKQCSVDFTTNRQLRAHLRVPNNPCSQQLKPFVCTICKIGFNTRNNCVRHIIKQHPATIECEDGDEEAATKLISAVTAAATGAMGGEPMTAEALIANMGAGDNGGGSNPSLSPGGRSSAGSAGKGGKRGGQKNGGSSDRGEPYSDEHESDECESSFGTNGSFDEEGGGGSPKKPLSLFTTTNHTGGSSPLVSPASNASFAALCQVAAVEQQKVEKNGGKSPVEEVKRSNFTALNLSVKSDEEGENVEQREDVLDLSAKPTASKSLKKADKNQGLTNGSLDLSLKPIATTSSSKLLNGNAGLINSSFSKFPLDFHHQFSSGLHQQIPTTQSLRAPAAAATGYPLEIASLMRGGGHHPTSTTSLLSLYKQQAEADHHHQQQQQQVAAALVFAQQQQAAAAAAQFDMNAMVATFAKYGQQAGLPNGPVGGGGISNETLASLMAQFHQHQAFASMKAPMAKNH